MARPLGAQNKDKPFRDALRTAISEADGDFKKLRRVADALIEKAMSGDVAAIREIGDRLDGKPAQEQTVTIEDKRDSHDWTRAELVAFLNNARTGGERASKANGRSREPDSVH